MAETDGRSLHSKIVEITNALQASGMERHRKKWEDEVASLNTNLDDIRSKLESKMQTQTAETKGARREKRYVGRLEAFGQWLDVVEFELACILV